MPIRRRRPTSEVNLRRVFRLLTLGVSLVLLLVGTLTVWMVWSEQNTEWKEATGARTHPYPEVYVMKLGVVQFLSGRTDQQIKDALDRSAPAAIEKAAARGTILRTLRTANPNDAELTDSQLASRLLTADPLAWSAVSEVVIGDGIQVALLPVIPPSVFRPPAGGHISHLYLAASPGQSSILYTRGQAIQAAAAADAKAILVLKELAVFFDSPRPLPAPFSLPRALALVIAGTVGLPWGLFFLIRWAARRYSESVDVDIAKKIGHVCEKCHGREIVRVERGDTMERLMLKLRGRLPYRCLDCDHRFLDRPLSHR